MKTKRFFWIVSALLALLFLAAYQYPGLCEGADVERDASEKSSDYQYSELEQAVSATLEQEQRNFAQLKEELSQTRGIAKGFDMEMDAYRIQVSTYSNLLSIQSKDVKSLEKADSQNRLTTQNVKVLAADYTLNKERIEQLSHQNDQNYQTYEQQLSRIKSDAGRKENFRTLTSALKTLIETLSEKRTVLEKLRAIYESRIATLEEIQGELSELSKNFDTQIAERKKETLFQRVDTPLSTFRWQEAGDDAGRLWERFRLVGTGGFWQDEFGAFLGPEGEWPVAGTVFFMVVIFFLFRIRRVCDRLKSFPNCKENPWRRMGLMILSRSLPLLGITLFAYLAIRIHYGSLPLLQLAVSILLSFLFSRWAIDFFILADREGILLVPSRLLFRLKAVFVSLRWIAVIYSVADYLTVDTSIILSGVRLILWGGLFLFGALFFRNLKRSGDFNTAEGTGQRRRKVMFLEAVTLLVLGIAVLLELSGYGAFALYWQVSLARSSVAILLLLTLFMMLKEWGRQLRHVSETDKGDGDQRGQPIQWIVSRICWLVWVVLAIFSFLFAWGASKTLLGGLFHAFRHSIAVGQMNFSLMGLFYAVLILFVTQLFARIFRYVLKEKLLDTNELEYGLKESIATIGTYLVWGFGILIALHAFGLNTASLTVALGALGIGLGFGLQNIFNNFISGIILLFERPIQVGDDVEINGVWATVKKINVRATIVQTVDNASLIIPNSEFISSQVTNWSFKDKRLRRRINVGVAYGSDIELVRKTLFEVLLKVPNVLKSPKPDVLFTDFGDSALLFQLRYWTTITHMLTTATDVRFEINRLFAERNITIAFPQLDVHMDHDIQKGNIPV